MRPTPQAVVLPSESADFAEEVQQVFNELSRTFSPEAMAGECSPPIDVYETDESIEIVVDLPGVNIHGVRVIAKGGTLLIVGHKTPRRVRGEFSFQLVERTFGRFARSVRVGRASDTSRAHARLGDGELHISLPKISERRACSIPITIEPRRDPSRPS